MDTTVCKHCLILLLYSVMSTTSAYLLVGCGVFFAIWKIWTLGGMSVEHWRDSVDWRGN
jgi:hypothetical protein